ncbi:MAG: hypothetical protein ABIN67_07575 [Ferruginibacter sp.]
MTTKNTIIYFTFLFALLFVPGCETTHNLPSQKAMYKNIYVDQFKLIYFRKILIKSYNNSGAIQEIIKSDNSGFTESILTEADYKLIDSLTTADNENLKADSTQGNRRAEGSQGKRPLKYILDKLNSNWLDSLANKRYKSSDVRFVSRLRVPDYARARPSTLIKNNSDYEGIFSSQHRSLANTQDSGGDVAAK